MELAFLLQLLRAGCFYATCFSLNLHNFMKFCSCMRGKESQVQRSLLIGDLATGHLYLNSSLLL